MWLVANWPPNLSCDYELMLSTFTVTLSSRDHGERADRQKARLMWLVENWGVDKFREACAERMGDTLSKVCGPVSQLSLEAHMNINSDEVARPAPSAQATPCPRCVTLDTEFCGVLTERLHRHEQCGNHFHVALYTPVFAPRKLQINFPAHNLNLTAGCARGVRHPLGAAGRAGHPPPEAGAPQTLAGVMNDWRRELRLNALLRMCPIRLHQASVSPFCNHLALPFG